MSIGCMFTHTRSLSHISPLPLRTVAQPVAAVTMTDSSHSDSAPVSDVKEKDLESGQAAAQKDSLDERHGSVTPGYEVAKTRHLQNAVPPLRFLSKGEEWLDGKLGIETQGIDRIPEEAKRPPSIWNTFFMWWSMTCHVGTVRSNSFLPSINH
jgi:hypothetical protein